MFSKNKDVNILRAHGFIYYEMFLVYISVMRQRFIGHQWGLNQLLLVCRTAFYLLTDFSWCHNFPRLFAPPFLHFTCVISHSYT